MGQKISKAPTLQYSNTPVFQCHVTQNPELRTLNLIKEERS